MPTVTLRALPPDDPGAIDRCHAAVARALGAAIGRAPEGVWCQWVPVGAAHVGVAARGPADQCPVVTIRARAGRSPEAVARGLEATARAVAAALDLPVEDVWVHWQDVPAGRVFAGGALR